MTIFVYMENGEILERHNSLPRAWRNISGFNHLESDLPKLNSLGWYPVQKNHQLYDPEMVRVAGVSYQLQDGVVFETLILEPYTDQERELQHQQRRAEFLSNLRSERNQKMAASDWTQVLDVNYAFLPVVREAWRAYRQELRDLPAQYENLSDYRNVSVTWPEPPK